MRPLNLRVIESRSWKTMQQNGLFDIFFGILLLANALSMLLDGLGVATALRIGTTLVLYGGGILGCWLARRRYVIPRTGTAKFGAQRRRRIHWMRIVLAISVLVTMALVALTTIARFSLTGWFDPLGDFAPSALIGIIILVSSAALAYTLDYPRIVIHGLLFVAGEFAFVTIVRVSSIPFPGTLAFGVAGAISLTIGITVFTRFLRTVRRIKEFPIGNAHEGPSAEAVVNDG